MFSFSTQLEEQSEFILWSETCIFYFGFRMYWVFFFLIEVKTFLDVSLQRCKRQIYLFIYFEAVCKLTQIEYRVPKCLKL